MRIPISPEFIYINIGHFLDHMIMLIFAKAAFSIGIDFGLLKDSAFAEMISYGIPALVLFGACAPVAAHLADKWNRKGMLTVFFIGRIFLTVYPISYLQLFQKDRLQVAVCINHP